MSTKEPKWAHMNGICLSHSALLFHDVLCFASDRGCLRGVVHLLGFSCGAAPDERVPAACWEVQKCSPLACISRRLSHFVALVVAARFKLEVPVTARACELFSYSHGPAESAHFPHQDEVCRRLKLQARSSALPCGS